VYPVLNMFLHTSLPPKVKPRKQSRKVILHRNQWLANTKFAPATVCTISTIQKLLWLYKLNDTLKYFWYRYVIP